jgi:hypothetical protein
MRSGFIVVAALAFLSLVCVSANEAQQNAPGEVVERFCKLDTSGKQLRAEGRKDLAPLFLDAGAPELDGEVIVIKDHSLRDLGTRKDATELAVDYRVWGRIDPSLRFTRLQPHIPISPYCSPRRFP